MAAPLAQVLAGLGPQGAVAAPALLPAVAAQRLPVLLSGARRCQAALPLALAAMA
jgi:hypothetical protein